MKTYKFLIFIAVFTLLQSFNVNAQHSAEVDTSRLPGDDFSLQGALEMFKKASSPEEFEKLINNADNHINNLDLNADGDIDYIRVIDKTEGEVHAFILQVPVSESEDQDIAVIELEKSGKNKAVIQIIGDEDIYGEQIIVEPAEEGKMEHEESMEPRKKGGPNQWSYESVDAVVINVWAWPTVRFVYAPAYTPWLSPWRWGLYPSYWRPWRPLAWRVFTPFHARYHRSYSVVHKHRVVRAHRIYTPVRVTSVSVNNRHSHAVKNYRVTKTKTTVTGKRGHVKVTKTKTKVRRR